MYGSYSRKFSDANDANARGILTSRTMADVIRRNGGRLTYAQLVKQFGDAAVHRAVELDRTVHMESRAIDGEASIYYVAN